MTKERRRLTGVAAVKVAKAVVRKLPWMLGIGAVIALGVTAVTHFTAKAAEPEPEIVSVIEDEVKGKILTDKKTITVSEVESALSDIGEYASEEYTTTEEFRHEDLIEIAGIDLGFTRTDVKCRYDVKIKAGIEMADVKVSVDELKKQILITIPEAEILDAVVDFDSLEIVDEKNNILNPISMDDINSSQKALVDTATKRALSEGILEKAELNAKRTLKQFVESCIDTTDYSVEVRNND